MRSEAELFCAFAKHRLQADMFDAAPDRDDTRLFHDQLASARGFLSWTGGAVNRRGEIFSAVPGYVETFTPNAFADRFDGRFFLGMHSALYAAINEFTMFCFAQRSFFAEIGDPSFERSPQPMAGASPGVWLLVHTRAGGHVESHHSAMLTPRCQKRYNASIYLAFLMSRFVWLHELAHAFNGHVSFIQDRNIALRLTEIADPAYAVSVDREPSDEDIYVVRMLELDADQSALWGSFRIQTDGLENVEGIAELPEPLRLKLTLFAGYAMTWLFEEFQAHLAVKNPRSHPPPRMRLLSLLDLASRRLAGLRRDFDGLNTAVCAEFDAIGGTIPGVFRPADLSKQLKDGKATAGHREWDQELQGLRNMLRDYQFSQKQPIAR